MGKQILTFDRKGKIVSDAQGVTLPHLTEDEKTIGLWRDKETKRLRFATRYLVPPAGIGGTIEKPVLKDSAGLEVKGLAKPEWGSHTILKVFEFVQATRKWDVIASLPTKTEAGDTPGISVLKPVWSEEGNSDIKLTSSKFCAKYGALYQGRQCHVGNDIQTRKTFLKNAFPQCELTPEGYLLDRGCPIDDVGQISCEGCAFDLLHASVEGDRLHAVLPLYLKNKITNDLTQVKQLSREKLEQVLIDQRGGYAVIESNRQPNQMYVLDLTTGEIILNARGRSSVWFPHE